MKRTILLALLLACAAGRLAFSQETIPTDALNAYPPKFLYRFISNAKSGDIIFLGSRLGGHFGTGNIIGTQIRDP
jgi:hypothetical protein